MNDLGCKSVIRGSMTGKPSLFLVVTLNSYTTRAIFLLYLSSIGGQGDIGVQGRG